MGSKIMDQLKLLKWYLDRDDIHNKGGLDEEARPPIFTFFVIVRNFRNFLLIWRGSVRRWISPISEHRFQ